MPGPPPSSDGWAESAQAWIAAVGEDGDFGRRFVLDEPMLARVRGRGFATALDVGCGEGRFCRMLRDLGVRAVGIDPTAALIDRARALDPVGDYRAGRAEDLESDAAFDLAVCYLTLIDIPDLALALAAIARALRPGGTLLIANLTSFNTAGMPDGWTREGDGSAGFRIDRYLEERAVWVAWNGIRVKNWHRPLSIYMSSLLDLGFELRHFAEPAPSGGDARRVELYRRVPYFTIMEWQAPAERAIASGG